MICADVDANMLARLYDELPASEAAAFDGHLASCETCAKAFTGLSETRKRFQLPAREVPAALAQALAALPETALEPSPATVRPLWLRALSHPLAIAASVALVVGSTVNLLRVSPLFTGENRPSIRAERAQEASARPQGAFEPQAESPDETARAKGEPEEASAARARQLAESPAQPQRELATPKPASAPPQAPSKAEQTCRDQLASLEGEIRRSGSVSAKRTAADCYASIGQFDRAKTLYTELLASPEHQSAASEALHRLPETRADAAAGSGATTLSKKSMGGAARAAPAPATAPAAKSAPAEAKESKAPVGY